MPIQKKKVKKDKNEAKPAGGTNIKQEPEELKPLAEYIDDRLELIRQVFSCVKPKEINYLLPDFLEGKSNDIIKERCLDELLGISTKRLRSIINNTKCPTDTESDSENSDLEKIEEHISLDEISSDSDADGKRSGKSGAARDKRKANAENSKSADERNGGDAKSEKEMTVLELLELQARARAIRSQLALEPVTKIEIDSEHEDEDARQADVDTDEETNRVTRKRASPKTVTGSSVENGKQPKTENSATEQQPRRVRLKRNFRVRQAGDDDSDAEEVSSNVTEKLPTPAPSEPESCPEPKQAETVEPTTEKAASVEVQKDSNEPKDTEKAGEGAEPNPTPTPAVVEKSSEVVAEADTTTTKEKTPTPVPSTSPFPASTASAPVPVEEDVVVDEQSKEPTTRDADRESSPEVIPVEASPETLCISSDSEEERLAKQRASIFVDNIEELDRQAQETVTEPAEKPADEDDEPEEGEISEEEEEEPPAPVVEESVPQESAPETQASKDADCAVENPSSELIAGDDKNEGGDTATTGNPVTQSTTDDMSAVAEEVQLLSSGSDESGSESSGDSGSGSSGSSDSEADENEERKKKTAEPMQKLDPTHDDADIVEIHDSGDEKLLLDDKPSEPENPEEKSWNSRWLKSNRVAKVMAASRLGNKVREKLKKKKQIQQAEQQQQQQQQQPQPDAEGTDSTKQYPASETQQAESAVAEQPSNVEVGSVEHYRELVAQQETKD
uniref:Putative microtubule-associated protein futsch n=1 Tax=Anopheles braziliensis TaxID=58242 RepID=A0A2M3ZFW1_9DIPT